MVDSKKAAAACAMLAQGFALMSEALGGDAVDLGTTEAPSKAARSAKVTDIETARNEKTKGARESKDKESSPSGKTSGDVASRKELAALDLETATRPEIIPLAKAFGLETKGAVTSDLIDALRKIQQGSTDATEEEVADASGADDDGEEIDYPDNKTMRRQFKLWAKAKEKELIKDFGKEFFDDTDDADDVDEKMRPYSRQHLTLQNEDVLKEQWKDNVYPLIQDGTWKKIEKAG